MPRFLVRPGLLNFQPKDARGVDKTTGKVDINDSSSSSGSGSGSESGSNNDDDRRAKTPTPHGRRKKMKKKKGQARNRSGSSSSSQSSSASSSDTAKEGSDDEKKEKKKEDSDKDEVKMSRFYCAKPDFGKQVSEKGISAEAIDAEPKSNESSEKDKEENDEKKKKNNANDAALSTEGGKRVSMSSSSSSSASDSDNASFSRSKKSDKNKAKGKGSSDDYSDSRKDESQGRKTSVPKMVDMGDENGAADGRDREMMESQRPVTVMDVGASPAAAATEVVKAEPETVKSPEAESEPETSASGKRKGSKQEVIYAQEQAAFYAAKPSEPEDRDDAASSSSSPSSSSSSSGSATIHDKGPNTINDPTLTLDDQWQGGSKGQKEEEDKEEKEKEETKNGDENRDDKKDDEEEKKAKVIIIREDLNKKKQSDSSSGSSSSSSDESDSDDEKDAAKKTTTWQAHADVHHSESQPESDPEATHGGNDPDNVANGHSLVNGTKSFEPAVPAKANPGSIRPLLEASQTTLEIKGVTLNKSQVYEVAEFMEGKPGINSVNLVNCGIDDDDIQKLMEAIRKSPSNPMMLNLGLNPLTVESVHHILTACKHKPSIEAVLLQGTRLGDDGVNTLIAGMMAQLEDRKMKGESTDQGIHELDLSDCKFGDQGALGVARLLTSQLDIDTLTLTHNHAISSDGWRAIGDGLKLNRDLETLTLDHNFIGDRGIDYVTQGLHGNTSVTAVDLNDVGITNKGGKSILELLKRNTFLLEITVMENKLSDEMSENIQKYINLNKASFSPK